MKYLSLLIVLIIAHATPALAQNTQRTPEIQKAERYLQSLKTAKARFVQTTSNGPQLTGDFYLNRPGKLRFQYDAPLKDYIVADGTFIYFYDGDINEQSNAPIGQTLADFILRPNIRLTNEDLNIKRIMHVDNMIQITIEQKTDPDAGSITLGFQKKPFQLSRWRVVDAMGSVTEIELTNLKTGMDFPSSLFAFFAPKKEGFND
jgi:outer membrane lipoprotein-sorting protein